MEHVLESFYEGFGVLLFCMAVWILFGCFGSMDAQTEYIKNNIYDQHILYEAAID